MSDPDALSRAREHFMRGLAAQQQGLHAQAAQCYSQALALAPDRPSVINNLAAVLICLERFDEALPLCERALALAPGEPTTLLNRAVCLANADPPEPALAAFDAAIAAMPGHVEALSGRCALLSRLGRHAEALENADAALAIDPRHVGALNNRAVALRGLGRHDEALAAYRAVGDLAPSHAESRFGEAMLRLQMGDLANGWAQYEWRWMTQESAGGERYAHLPRWHGERVERLLAWADQGVGDHVLFGSLVAETAERVGQLVLEVDPRLVRLFERAHPGVTVLAQRTEASVQGVDCAIALGSLGALLRTSLASFPSQRAPWLRADPDKIARMRARLAGAQRLTVGLSWITTNRKNAPQRTLRLAELAPVLSLPDIRFVDLQYGDTANERAALARDQGIAIERIAGLDTREDLDGLAAAIMACDLVITIGNATAHLAGALGRETWTLLPRAAREFWLLDRDDSPWYPGMRLIRQRSALDWASVIATVRERLLAFRTAG